MSDVQQIERNIAVLTEVLRAAATPATEALDTVLAEVQRKLASRTYNLADERLRLEARVHA